MSRLQLLIAVLCLGALAGTAEAQRFSVGIGIGLPIYPRPYYAYPYPGWGYYYRPYVYPYPYPYVYAAPPVAVVETAPAPVVAQVPTTVVAPAPAAASATPATAPPPTIVQANNSTTASRVEQFLSQLSQPQESARRDAAIELGRLKAVRAVDPLVSLLSSDGSPVVRDAAARALGLIASPQSLTALIHAAQADQDRDVRHSAQFSVEIIRSNLRGQ